MGTVTDLTIRTASLDELRRRAAEGDQSAVAELARRRAEEATGGEGGQAA